MTMEKRSEFDHFIEKVTAHIKSKDAKRLVEQELTNHLEQSSLLLQKGGLSKEAADAQSIKYMGNPAVLGRDLHRLHKPRIDWGLIALFIVIISLGFLPLLAFDDVFRGAFIYRNAVLSLITIAGAVLMQFIDYRILQRFRFSLYFIACVLIVANILFGTTIHGRLLGLELGASGLRLGFLFPCLLLYLSWAGILRRLRKDISFAKQTGLFLLCWAPFLLFIWSMQYMLAISYLAAVIGMAAISGIDKRLLKRFFYTNLFTVALVALAFFLTAPQHVKDRIFVFIHPYGYDDNLGYFPRLIKKMLTEAGWFGQGLETNIHHALPDFHTDLVFPFLVFTFGWLFGIFLVGILVMFIWRIGNAAKKAADLYGKLLVGGGLLLFTVPIIYNVLMGTSLLPITSVSLPFISYGGDLSFFYAAITGIILSVYRRKDVVVPA
ncbi:cell division protein FtsW, lipid II flippase [Evansella caseinilytica]|uniref:Cell division protein FtsW, lipid II flippase n=1 Tax=Evansella caseinilytica TaxID=1503961 RepID=A0A1H3RAQ7_9BACI|nr:FtsW/RodA/SpoVE family cell cycle protein [Evansella caseinilytica]SDZ22757.1 cell division protein FtsW, lipid II flippase [Evansella caseinilytica]